ncbi:MAG TPA: hypothetical protein VKF42_03290 [Chitinivibrionales bacterium]|jgi:hypothetical protein|nr:hypothetical protein [Chitinivibrionales bacterium]
MIELPVEKHFPPEFSGLYELRQWKHACAILKNDFRDEWNDLLGMLSSFRLRKAWITKGGKNKTDLVGR